MFIKNAPFLQQMNELNMIYQFIKQYSLEIAIGLITSGLLLKAHNRNKREEREYFNQKGNTYQRAEYVQDEGCDNKNEQISSEETNESETSTNISKRSTIDAVVQEEEYSKIQGIITHCKKITEDTYLGIITDNKGSIPFYIDVDELTDTREKEGLIHFILQESTGKENPLILYVEKAEDIHALKVLGIEAKIYENIYKIVNKDYIEE